MKKSIKNVFCVLLSATMLLGGVSAVYGGEKSISLQINGSEISAEVPPTVIDGRTMVPVRAIFEAVGANIDFDAETKTITAKKGDTTVNMTVGAKVATGSTVRCTGCNSKWQNISTCQICSRNFWLYCSMG